MHARTAAKLFWLAVPFGLHLPLAGQTSQAMAALRNRSLVVTAEARDGSYAIAAAGAAEPAIRAATGAQAGGRWLRSADYPRHAVTHSAFTDGLGAGEELTIINGGWPGQPDLVTRLRLYAERPYGSVQVSVRNTTQRPVLVSDLQLLRADRIRLGGADASDRILPDSYSEDRPELRIIDLGAQRAAATASPARALRGIGSELIYNRASGEALFFGALTSQRFLTYLHNGLSSQSGELVLSPFTIDSAGTTEVQRDYALRGAPPAQQVELRLPLAPGQELSSEMVMFALGADDHSQLENYGAVIRRLHRARAAQPNLMGWWSWTAYYFGLDQGAARTNAQWQAEHLRRLGYRYFHVDEGYQYARGEYTTANAAQFPDGMAALGRQINQWGLAFGLWTAPFEVSSRAWVYQHHRDWLVRDGARQPIQIGSVGSDRLYVLDATNPGAQAYLRQTYRTLTRDWGARYLKLDFMDDTAIEGSYYRPHTTALEAQRIGLGIIRAAVGPDVILDKDGSPMLNPVGMVDAGRVSVDTGHDFQASKDAAPGIAARYYMNRNFFLDDPDAFSVSTQVIADQTWHQGRRPLTLDEARVAIVLAAVSGGMFEIGDDLPLLGEAPERLALVENPELLQMARLSRAAEPVDLMTYAPEDEQPSIFLLREDRRQAMLAVFNWTEQPRTHTLTVAHGSRGWRVNAAAAEAGVAAGAGGASLNAFDALEGDVPVALERGDQLSLPAQPPHSVRLFKLVDPAVAASAPAIAAEVPQTGQTGATLAFAAHAADAENAPVLDWRWDFGDGSSATGAAPRHAYTHPGDFTVSVTAAGVDGVPARHQAKITVRGALATQFAPRRNRRFAAH